MAFQKTLAHRLFNISRIASPLSPYSCRVSNPDKIIPDLGDDGIFRRFTTYKAPTISPELRSLPTGEKLLEKLRGIDYSNDRIRLDGFRPPETVPKEGKLTVEDARRILNRSQSELVLGNAVFLKPQQVKLSEQFGMEMNQKNFKKFSDFLCNDLIRRGDLINNRKNILRPLSPHLPVYKPQLTSTLSISHRISAAFLSAIVLFSYLVYLKMGLICFTYDYFYQFLFYSSKLFLISAEISALAMAYHVYSGVRHLLADFSGFLFLRKLLK